MQLAGPACKSKHQTVCVSCRCGAWLQSFYISCLFVSGWTPTWSCAKAWSDCWTTQTLRLSWTPTQGHFTVAMFHSSSSLPLVCPVTDDWMFAGFPQTCGRALHVWLWDQWNSPGRQTGGIPSPVCVSGPSNVRTRLPLNAAPSSICRGKRPWRCTSSCWTWATSSWPAPTCPTESPGPPSRNTCTCSLPARGASSKSEVCTQTPPMTWYGLVHFWLSISRGRLFHLRNNFCLCEIVLDWIFFLNVSV